MYDEATLCAIQDFCSVRLGEIGEEMDETKPEFLLLKGEQQGLLKVQIRCYELRPSMQRK